MPNARILATAAIAAALMPGNAHAEALYFCTIKNNTGAGTDKEIGYIIERSPAYAKPRFDEVSQHASDKSNENSKLPYVPTKMHCSYTSHSYPGRDAHFVVLKNTDPKADPFFIYRFGWGYDRAEAIRKAQQVLASQSYEVVEDKPFFNGKQ